MNIKHLEQIISSLIIAVFFLMPISGHSADAINNSTPVTKAKYNIGNVPSFAQWNAKETGNLAVVFTADDSAANNKMTYSMFLNKDKFNIASKDFSQDQFSCFTLKPGEYTIKSILSGNSRETQDTVLYTKVKIEPGKTTAFWSNTTTNKALAVKTKVLDRKQTQYVYSTAISYINTIKLNPQIIFDELSTPSNDVNTDNSVDDEKVSKLKHQKIMINKETAAIRKHTINLAEDIKARSQTLEPLYKWKKLVLNKEEASAENLDLAKRRVSQVFATINDLKIKKRELQQKIVNFSHWLSRGRAASVQNKLDTAAQKRELADIKRKLSNSELTITNLSTVYSKNKQSINGLYTSYEQLTAEQTVLAKICRTGTKAKESANTALAHIDKEIALQKSKRQEAETLMESLMTTDKVSDEKLAEINGSIKDIDAEIKRQKTKRQVALNTIDDCLLQLGKHKEKLSTASNNTFELLKNIELAKKGVGTAELVLNRAKLSQKDILVDKRILETRIVEAEAGAKGNLSRSKEFTAESADLKNQLTKLDKEEWYENKKVTQLQKSVSNAQEVYDTAKNNLQLIVKKIEATESSISDLKRVQVNNKERDETLQKSIYDIDNKIIVAQSTAKLEKENENFRSRKEKLNQVIVDLRDKESEFEEKIELGKSELTQTKQQVADLENELQKIMGELKVSKTNNSSGKTKAEQIIANLKKAEAAKQQLKEEMVSVNKKLTEQEQEIKSSREVAVKLKQSEETQTQLKKAVASANKRLNEKEQEMAQARADSVKIQNESEILKQKIKDLTVGLLRKDEALVENKEKYMNADEIEKQFSSTLTELENERKKQHDFQLSQKKLESLVKVAESKVSSMTKSNESAQQVTDELKMSQKTLIARIAALESELKIAGQLVIKEQIQTQVAQKELLRIQEDRKSDVKDITLELELLAQNKKELQDEVNELEKTAKIKDVLVASYSKQLRDKREISKIAGYRRIPQRY